MPYLSRYGFSVVELIVALLLSAVAAAAAFGVLGYTQRTLVDQAARMELDQDVRAAVSILEGELRPLHPDDIIDMTPGSLTYRATRSVRFLCRPPDSLATRVTLADSPRFGDAALSTAGRALLLYAAGEGRWLRVSLSDPMEVAACPGGQPGTAIRLLEVSPDELAQVETGSPLYSQETVRIQAYRDGDGTYWLGARATTEDGAWSDIQPFAGPVAAGGLELEYFDATGRTTAYAVQVARIAVTVTGRSTASPSRTFRLSTQVALRNRLR